MCCLSRLALLGFSQLLLWKLPILNPSTHSPIRHFLSHVSLSIRREKQPSDRDIEGQDEQFISLLGSQPGPTWAFSDQSSGLTSPLPTSPWGEANPRQCIVSTQLNWSAQRCRILASRLKLESDTCPKHWVCINDNNVYWVLTVCQALKTLPMLVHFILTRSFLLWCSPTCLFLLLLVLWVLLLLFSGSILSDFLQPHELQNARLPCPSLSPRVCSNSCPLNPWSHATTLFSINPFSSCPQSFPASGSFPVSWLFPSGGQSIGASASVSVLPMNIQGWFPLGLTGFIFLGAISFPKPCETEIITITSTLQMRKLKLRIIKEELVNGGARICF